MCRTVRCCSRENRLQFIRRFPHALLRASSFMPMRDNLLCSHRHRSNCILKQPTHHNHHAPPPTAPLYTSHSHASYITHCQSWRALRLPPPLHPAAPHSLCPPRTASTCARGRRWCLQAQHSHAQQRAAACGWRAYPLAAARDPRCTPNTCSLAAQPARSRDAQTGERQRGKRTCSANGRPSGRSAATSRPVERLRENVTLEVCGGGGWYAPANVDGVAFGNGAVKRLNLAGI